MLGSWELEIPEAPPVSSLGCGQACSLPESGAGLLGGHKNLVGVTPCVGKDPGRLR